MSIKKEKIPIVRFRDFSEPWIKKQLSEVAEFSKGRGYSKKDLQSHGTPVILYGRLYTNYESVISNVETYANLEENSVVSEGGEVIIPASGESADDISRASCVIDRGIILGGDLNIVRPHEYLNSLFIAMTLSNGSQQRELSKRAQGKSVVHLHNSDLKAIKLFYPSFEEQSAIGSLFRTLDDLLASYKDNLANYQSLKATMLSKMFPKAGQTVPEIRLDGFEGEWKLYELKSRTEIITKGTTPKDKSWQGEVNYIKTESINRDTGSLVRTASTSLEEHLGYLKRSILKEGDVLFSIVGTLGVVGIVDKKDLPANTNQQIAIIRLKRDDAIFMLNFLKSPRIKSFIKSDSTIGAQPSLSLWQIEKIKVSFPSSLEEQQAIGSYFSSLDQLITSYQEKITQLETLKKKLLQDMFI